MAAFVEHNVVDAPGARGAGVVLDLDGQFGDNFPFAACDVRNECSRQLLRRVAVVSELGGGEVFKEGAVSEGE